MNEGYNANVIVEELKLLLSSYELPHGYTLKFTGEQEEQAESSAFLASALMIAVFSIFLIIVAQFNSVSSPFIIMASVVLSTIGVFLGLVIFKMDFIIIMTGIGIISLAGVVVNNAIVLYMVNSKKSLWSEPLTVIGQKKSPGPFGWTFLHL